MVREGQRKQQQYNVANGMSIVLIELDRQRQQQYVRFYISRFYDTFVVKRETYSATGLLQLLVLIKPELRRVKLKLDYLKHRIENNMKPT